MGTQPIKFMDPESGPKPARKPPGLVWISCPYPVIACGLKEFLKEEATLYISQEEQQVPQGQTPSLVIICVDEPDNVTSKVERLREEVSPHTPILIFGLRVDLQIGREAFQAGVHGFIHAGMKAEQILNAVALASSGEVVIPVELFKGLVAEEAVMSRTETLTSRQQEILGLVAEGLTNGQIAKRLYLSEFTLKQHLRRTYKLLGVKNRTEAANLFRKQA